MTPEQESHLKRIKNNFVHRVDLKYREGQREHGGDLINRNILSLIDETIAETIDTIVYLETLREVIIGEGK